MQKILTTKVDTKVNVEQLMDNVEVTFLGLRWKATGRVCKKLAKPEGLQVRCQVQWSLLFGSTVHGGRLERTRTTPTK